MNSERVDIGMIHGRFHPFHLGHLSYARLTRERCRFLIVGITNPDPRHLKQMPGDDHRHLVGSNPFTYFERSCMVQRSLLDDGMQPMQFTVVPFPIDSPDLWSHYVPDGVVHFLRDRGDWTQTKIRSLRNAGYAAHLLDDAENLEIAGTAVRRRLVERSDWRGLVTQGTVTVLEEIHAEERLIALNQC